MSGESMSGVLEGGEHLERELTPEPIAGPAMSSFVLHGLLLAALVFYGVMGGLFHHNLWGNQGAGGAMQVNLVSNALPLPNNQPVNKNVLTTEKPSQAPAPPSPKEQKQMDEKAIPISGKQVKPQEQTTPKTQPQSAAADAGQPGAVRRADGHGDSAGDAAAIRIQRTDGGGRQRFCQPCLAGTWTRSTTRWPIAGTSRKWIRARREGARVYLVFTIHRDGSPSISTGPVKRKPDAGPVMRARRATGGHVRIAAGGLQPEHVEGLILL